MYTSFLPKGGHPFVYLSLDIEPHRVDVNVHPTKREVNFLHEDEIIESVCSAVQEQLAAVDTSRQYTLTQTLLPGTQLPAPTTPRASSKTTPALNAPSTSTQRKPYENNTVRVDARDRKITSMLPSAHRRALASASSPTSAAEPGISSPTAPQPAEQYTYDDTRQWEDVRYASVRTLRKQVREAVHNALMDLFTNHIYVGLVDDSRRLAAVQHGVKLYLIDYGAVCYELFYQIGLADFRNYGMIKMEPVLRVREILEIAVEEEREKWGRKMQEQRNGGNNPREAEGDGSRDQDEDETLQEMDWEGVTEVSESHFHIRTPIFALPR